MSDRAERKKTRLRYSSISIPISLIREIEKLVRELGYWPTKTAFIREACLEKMEKHRNALRDLKG